MDSIFFLLSKLIWAVIAPGSLLLILVLFILVMLSRGKILLVQWSLGCLASVLLAVTLFPVGEWLLYPLEAPFLVAPVLPKQIDGVIVLTGAKIVTFSGTGKQVEATHASTRDIAFLALAKRYPTAKLVVTGGSSYVLDQEQRAADVAKVVYKENGLDVSRVIFERESRNTFENAVHSKQIVKPHRSEKWLLITSAFHMSRSVGIFCKMGWPVIPYPVDAHASGDNLFRIEIDLARHLFDLDTGMREWIGLLAYYLSGKTTNFLPLGCT